MKEYREKDVMSSVWNVRVRDLEFIENGKTNLIVDNMGVEKNGEVCTSPTQKQSRGVDGISGTQSNIYDRAFLQK